MDPSAGRPRPARSPGILREARAAKDPLVQFRRWYKAETSSGARLPDAVILATATPRGRPSARTVLLNGADERGFVFYTNYGSRKGLELAGNPWGVLLFPWAGWRRQVRIEGRVEKVPAGESDAYFRTRPRESRLSAWASRQSRVIDSRKVLTDRVAALTAGYRGQEIPRPPYWGGYRLIPQVFEFWQSRPNRLHDRLRYRRLADGRWRMERLSP